MARTTDRGDAVERRRRTSIGWLLRFATYVAVNYAVWLAYYLLFMDISTSHDVWLLAAPLETLLFVVVFVGLPTALLSMVDRLVLARTDRRWAVLTMVLLAPVPALILSGDGQYDDFAVQLITQILYGCAVAWLNYMRRSVKTA